jgi:hypothetical protein
MREFDPPSNYAWMMSVFNYVCSDAHGERERERERTCVNAAAKDSIAMYTQMSGHCWRPFDNNFPSSVAARFPPIATSWFDHVK